VTTAASATDFGELSRAVLMLACLAGCSGFVATDPYVVGSRASQTGETGQARLDEPAAAHPAGAAWPELAGAGFQSGVGDIEPVVIELPSLGPSPRYLRSSGPFYAQFQLSPYVGQFGILADAERADSGVGYGAVFGYRIPVAGANALGIEFIYESSRHHNDASDVDARATRAVAGMRMSFRMDERVVPFGVAGVGSYKLEFDGLDPTFNLSGLGVMLGGGLNFAPSSRFSLRTELALHIWDAAQESGAGGTAETLTLGLGAALSF
jgi:opacity protein-like surface antigen